MEDIELRLECLKQSVNLITTADSASAYKKGFGFRDPLYSPTELADVLFEYIKLGTVKPLDKTI